MRLLARLLEVLVIAATFAAAGSWPAPDTNESHYLAKARHFQDPGWCSGDFFLETPEAHHIFYRLIGPLAASLPLEQAAWVGRIAGWLALAAGIEWVLVAVVDGSQGISLWRILSAALWSLAVRHTPASGEWVIGGCEGKVFAWSLVFVSAGWFARGRPAAAWFTSGLATAMHAVVGGWSLVECGLSIVATWFLRRDPRPPLMVSMLMGLGGAAAAAIGIVPALTLSRGLGAEEAAEAVRIYVTERLPHHLLVETFTDGMVARHTLALLLAVSLLQVVRRTPAIDRLVIFVGAAVAIAVAGCGVSLLTPYAPRLSYALLRFYWFRLSDGLVPLLLASVATLAVRDADGPAFRRRWLLALLALLAVDLANESRHWPLPWRAPIASRSDRHVAAAAWEDVCGWIRTGTPPGARFLTPRGSASFQWRAERPEVVSWKHVPQNLQGILEWRRRLLDCFAVDAKGSLRTLERSTAVFGADRMRDVAARYEAEYAVVPIDAVGAAGPLPFEQVYANTAYVVYRIP